eukprot:6490620-Amphidinium_carterae.7
MSYLNEYISKSSFLIARGHEVTDIVVALQNMESKPAAVVPLLNMMKTVPALQQGLRPVCTIELLKLLRLKLGEVWEAVNASAEKDEHVLSNTSVLMAEAILLFPFDTDLQACSQDVAKLMREQNEGKMVEGILNAAEKIKSISAKDIKHFKEAIDEFLSQVKDVGGTSKLTAEQEGVFIGTEAALITFIQEHYTKMQDQMALFESIAQVGLKIASLIGSRGMADMMQALVEAISMEKLKTAHAVLGGPPDTDPEDKYLSSCLGLIRQQLKVQGIIKDLTGTKFKLQVQLDHSLTGVKGLIDNVKKQWTEMVKNKVTEKWESLKIIAGGKEQGHWLDGYQGGNCWDTLLQHGKKVLLVGDPKALPSLHTETHEAIGRGPPIYKRSEATLAKTTITEITFSTR